MPGEQNEEHSAPLPVWRNISEGHLASDGEREGPLQYYSGISKDGKDGRTIVSADCGMKSQHVKQLKLLTVTILTGTILTGNVYFNVSSRPAGICGQTANI